MSLTVKLFISDIDGVMTDGGIFYTESGERFKKFNVRDTMGFTLIKQNGIIPTIIYADKSPIVQMLAQDMDIHHWYHGVKDKHQLALDLCEKEGIQMQDVAFIGDDTNDLDLMANVGIAACPSDAPKIITQANNLLVLKSGGGNGAVREFVDYILDNEFY